MTAMAAGACAVFRKVGPNHRLQGGLQNRDPYRGERRTHVGDVEHAQQIGRGNAGQLTAAQRARNRDGPNRIALPARRGHQRTGHRLGVDLEQLGT